MYSNCTITDSSGKMGRDTVQRKDKTKAENNTEYEKETDNGIYQRKVNVRLNTVKTVQYGAKPKRKTVKESP